MNLSDFLEKWGHNIFETPLAIPAKSEEPPELAEIRLALIEQIRTKSYRAGGRKVFPFDLLRIFVRGIEARRSGIFTGRFFHQYLEQELRNGLRNAECRFPEALRVEVETTPELPGPGEEWLRVEALSAESTPAKPAPRGRLAVMEGTPNVAELSLDKPRVNIGRAVDVYRSEGLFRRNDLAFAAETEINSSVSREHAHITFDSTEGEYRLHNDRWYPLDGGAGSNCATWIVRDGMSQPVHRNTRGVRLEDGDEIHFGQAVVRFRVE